MKATEEPLVQAIHKLWFGALDAEGQAAPEKSQQWFSKNPEFDTYVKRHYQEYVDPAYMGAFDRWLLEDIGLVALTILLDQFPRNMFRNAPRSFAYDKKALAVCQVALHNGRFLKMPTLHAYFSLMPTMHSEILEVQDQGVKAFRELLEITPSSHRSMIANALRYAEAHREIIVRFGRFPHRNAIKDRVSTQEEQAFLSEPGSSF